MRPPAGPADHSRRASLRRPALAPISRSLVLLAAALLFARQPGTAQSSALSDQPKPRNANVSILALTGFAHLGFAGNEDIYLADVAFKQGGHDNVKLIDTYAQVGNPLRRDLLADRRVFRMSLVRTPTCDEPANNVLLSAREANIFDASTRATFSGSEAIVPCYKVVHDATKLVKR